VLLAMKGWHPVHAAPRDGTPVILWMNDDESPPVLPVTVGFWTTDDMRSAGFWHIFGDHDGTQSCCDEQIRGWRPLLRGHGP
jgi:hypothetical protein